MTIKEFNSSIPKNHSPHHHIQPFLVVSLSLLLYPVGRSYQNISFAPRDFWNHLQRKYIYPSIVSFCRPFFIVHYSVASVLVSLFITGTPLSSWPTRKISRCQAHAMFRLLHSRKSSRQPKVHGPFSTGQKYWGMLCSYYLKFPQDATHFEGSSRFRISVCWNLARSSIRISSGCSSISL